MPDAAPERKRGRGARAGRDGGKGLTGCEDKDESRAVDISVIYPLPDPTCRVSAGRKNACSMTRTRPSGTGTARSDRAQPVPAHKPATTCLTSCGRIRTPESLDGPHRLRRSAGARAPKASIVLSDRGGAGPRALEAGRELPVRASGHLEQAGSQHRNSGNREIEVLWFLTNHLLPPPTSTNTLLLLRERCTTLTSRRQGARQGSHLPRTRCSQVVNLNAPRSTRATAGYSSARAPRHFHAPYPHQHLRHSFSHALLCA